VALSPDRPEALRESRKAKDLGYRLLSDSKMEASRAFGLAWQVSPAEVQRLAGYGIDIEAASGETHHQLPVPAVYLIDTDGRIVFRSFDPDYKVRLGTDELLAAARRSFAANP